MITYFNARLRCVSICKGRWGLHDKSTTAVAIDNFIARLRRYIEDNSSKPQHLLCAGRI